MSQESTKDRSPRSPAIYLEKAIRFVGGLHGECRRNPVSQETAAKAMGFNTVHGGVLSLFAGLREYGLIDRPSSKVAVTPLAVKILHPLSDQQRKEAVQEAALAPKVFRDLLNDFGDASLSVIQSHLVQSGFTEERAQIVAKVFTKNKIFAQLESNSKIGVSEPPIQNETPSSSIADARKAEPLTQTDGGKKTFTLLDPLAETLIQRPKMLAQYTIPLGSNQATLVFTGDQLTVDDFDALLDFVAFSKRQFERAQKARDEKPSASFDTLMDLEGQHPGAGSEVKLER